MANSMKNDKIANNMLQTNENKLYNVDYLH